MGDVTLFEGQVHDFEPGIEPSGLFWTKSVDDDSVRANLNQGRAVLEVEQVNVKDFFNFENAIIGPPSNRRAAKVSFKVVWEATGPVNQWNSADWVDNPANHLFRGEFRDAVAKMNWSARSGDFEFRSDPIGTSTTDAAELGRESNGSFY